METNQPTQKNLYLFLLLGLSSRLIVNSCPSFFFLLQFPLPQDFFLSSVTQEISNFLTKLTTT